MASNAGVTQEDNSNPKTVLFGSFGISLPRHEDLSDEAILRSFNKNDWLFRSEQSIYRSVVNLSIGLVLVGLLLSLALVIIVLHNRRRSSGMKAFLKFAKGTGNVPTDQADPKLTDTPRQGGGGGLNNDPNTSSENALKPREKSREEIIMDIIENLPEDLKITPDEYEDSWIRKGYDYAILDQQTAVPGTTNINQAKARRV